MAQGCYFAQLTWQLSVWRRGMFHVKPKPFTSPDYRDRRDPPWTRPTWRHAVRRSGLVGAWLLWSPLAAGGGGGVSFIRSLLATHPRSVGADSVPSALSLKGLHRPPTWSDVWQVRSRSTHCSLLDRLLAGRGEVSVPLAVSRETHHHLAAIGRHLATDGPNVVRRRHPHGKRS
jgi:hypothetical protein